MTRWGAVLSCCIAVAGCQKTTRERADLTDVESRLAALEADNAALQAALASYATNTRVDDLETELDSLSGSTLQLISTSLTRTVPGDHQTLPEALEWLDRRAITSSGSVTIALSGTQQLDEPVVISHRDGSRVTIAGGTLSFPSTGGIVVATGRSVRLQDLTVEGAGTGIGIHADGGASIRLTAVTVEGFQTGIRASRGSVVDAPNVVVRNNGGAGVEVLTGSQVDMTSSTIEGNGQDAVYVQAGSATLTDAQILENDGNGLNCGLRSECLASDAILDGNGQSGLAVYAGYASATGATISNNQLHGIICDRQSTCVASTAVIADNGAFGVLANGQTFVDVTTATVTGNAFDYGAAPSGNPGASVYYDGTLPP